MMYPTLSVVGVGNMAKAILTGLMKSDLSVSKIYLYDKFPSQCEDFLAYGDLFQPATSVAEAVYSGEYVLLAVKPQNYDEVLSEIVTVKDYQNKIYISIPPMQTGRISRMP